SQEVTNRLQVINGHGVYDSGNSNVGSLKLTVRHASGSDNVDLSTTTIKFLTDDQVVTLKHGGTANATHFATAEVQDDDTSISNDNVLNADTDRATVTIDTAAIQSGLGTNTDVRLVITTAGGGTTQTDFTTPDTYSGKSDTDPVGLQI
ncbi:MAG: flagellin, partial [Haloferacaceae archaeon]